MTFEELFRLVRAQRARIEELREASAASEDDISGLIVEQALYDSRLVELARMVGVALPDHMPHDGGLYSDHRAMIEDRLAAAGAEVRRA